MTTFLNFSYLVRIYIVPRLFFIKILTWASMSKVTRFTLRSLLWRAAIVHRFSERWPALAVTIWLLLLHHLLPVKLILSFSNFACTHVGRLRRLAVLLDFGPGSARILNGRSRICNRRYVVLWLFCKSTRRLHIAKSHHMPMTNSSS